MRLPIFDRLDRLLLPGRDRDDGDKRQKVYELLKERMTEELEKPTHIAVIGKCGVGKTSTINALFGTDWKISHVRAATKREQVYLYESDRGKLKISDLPGLGEDLETEDEYRALYMRVLNDCEVALFVLKADTRDMLDVQRILRDVVNSAMPDVANRIVIGLNQVDLVQPGAWIEGANVPSLEQERSIASIIRERLKSIQKVCPIKRSQVIAYSAVKRYRLVHLFQAMIACTNGEAWVLNSKKRIADWRELVDTKYLPPGLQKEVSCRPTTKMK